MGKDQDRIPCQIQVREVQEVQKKVEKINKEY